MKRYFLEIAYDGTNYHGWQIQENAHTVQGELNAVIERLCNENIKSMGCGRTDTGVHASKFYVHFDLQEGLKYSYDQFLFKLNALLPSDISVKNILEVLPESHARFDALQREYQYHIHFAKNPFKERFSLQVLKGDELNLVLMNEACEVLKSYQDFSSFSKSHSGTKTNLCHVQKAYWSETSEGICFTIMADRFLRNMVRAIVGTLLEVGSGKMTIEELKNVVESKNRGKAGKSVDGKALFLTNVTYSYISE